MSRHHGLNVAYWNVDERPLIRDGNTIRASGDRMLLFHFSGFDWPRTGKLSKHATHVVQPGSPLEDLCRQYQADLEGAAPLRAGVAGPPTYPCSKAHLAERIRVGTARTGARIESGGIPNGFFTRLGGKVDAVVRRLGI